MQKLILILGLIIVLANCQPEDYELTLFDNKTNSLTGFLTNAVEIYSYDPVTLRFPGCGECYFRFPFTKFFGKTDMTFSFHARWESFNSWSRILDFGFGPDSNNILFANRGGEPHITVRYMNGVGLMKQAYYLNTLQLGVWAHFALQFVVKTGEIIIYKNGQLLTIGGYDANNINVFTESERIQLFIGKSNWPDGFFNGYLSEWKYYSRRLSLDEIVALQNTKTIRPAEYSLDEYKFLLYNPYEDKYYGTYLQNATIGQGYVSNKAHFFDGNGQFLQLTPVPLGNAMTIACFAKFDALNVWSRIFEFSNGPDNNQIIMGNEGGTNVFQCEVQEFLGWATRRRRLKHPNSIVIGTWNHWACTIDNNGYMQLFMNGVLVQKSSANMGPLEHVFAPTYMQRTQHYLGKSTYPQDQYFKGAIDDFRLYERVLTLNEVAKLADKTRKIDYQPKPKHVCQGAPYAELYSECQYVGDVFVVCEQNADISIPWDIKSIKIFENFQLKLYANTDFDGDFKVFTENVDCLEGPVFQ